MKKFNPGLCFSIILLLSSDIAFSQLYRVKDFTAENLFTNNIEGPNIDSKGNFFIVNFQHDGTIGLVHANGTVELWATLPEGSVGNAIMFDRKGNLLIADFKGHNILKIDKKTKKVSTFSHDAFNQPNDFCISRKGQLFLSDPDWKNQTGKLWRVDTNGTAIMLMSGMGTINGIELSPDEKTLYVNESVQRKIWSFEVGENGSIRNKKLFYEFDDYGLDGMKCDVAGNLYVTRWGKGTVVVFDPAGKLIREIHLTGKNVSNITFGGPENKTCFVTLQDRKCIETFESEFAGKN